MKKQYRFVSQSIFALVMAALFFFAVVAGLFYPADYFLTDTFYSHLGTPSSDIVIVSVEDSTLEEFGSFSQFSREKTAELLEFLSADEANAPAVIGLDIIYTGETDETTDAALVAAVQKAGNVVLASSNMYRSTLVTGVNGERYVDTRNIDDISRPFEALSEAAVYGFTNANISKDGVIRSARLSDIYEGERIYSFDLYVIDKYAGPYDYSKLVTDNIGFYFTGKPGEYAHYPLERVLRGEIPASEFRDKIVLVGAYAAGMGDSYVAASSRAVEMNGVEIHANVIQAIMEDSLYYSANVWAYGILAVLVWFVVLFFCGRMNLVPAVIAQAAIGGLHILFGMVLAGKGIVIPQFYFLLLTILTIIYFVVSKYFIERWKKKKVLDSFKKYVAPQVVDGLSKNEDFETKLGGRKKDVAVLFVDIRGFTPLSESLEPEQVVGVLDEYLALTTECIFKNNGTLDKFIGDATMAIFNAPFDLDDYEMWAIKAALDIRAGGDKMAEVLYERYGKKVHFGIGVNCGDAVVGNIGCDIRMDYTAIGDTVNTAARLEGKAAPDEILISPKLYERVKDRIIAEQVGEMALKGKAEAMLVYRVLGLKEGN